MKRLPILTLALALIIPSAANAQRDTTGVCGDTTSFTAEDYTLFEAPMFVSPDSDYVRIRAEFGIVRQPDGTSARFVTDERVCRRLAHVVREALRTKNPTTLRFNDVVPTYLRIGRYYYVPLGLKVELPRGLHAPLPNVIIDGETMTVVAVTLG
ncbi:MAG TPA: hypothetical protein VFJ82_01040 [Longimicrobium sp.]|nr:hypothetical protein [Longimicrobium sp.]